MLAGSQFLPYRSHERFSAPLQRRRPGHWKERIMVKRGWDAISGSMGLVALIMGSAVCFADTLELEPHWRLDRIRSRLPKAFRASRRRARLSPASRQVRASGDYRAQPTLDAFRRMPGSGRVARKRRDQGECGVQRFHQLHDPNDANQSQVRRRDRLQSDRRDVARHDLCQMPPVAAGHVFQPRVAPRFSPRLGKYRDVRFPRSRRAPRADFHQSICLASRCCQSPCSTAGKSVHSPTEMPSSFSIACKIISISDVPLNRIC